MNIATLIKSLKSKKHSAERSAFGHYMQLVRDLASGAEVDSDECSHVLEAGAVDESDLERDVGIQQQRNAWHAGRQQHWQAIGDQQQAESELAFVQNELSVALRKYQPRIDAAREKIRQSEHIRNITTHCEARLLDPENILDRELLERESAIIAELKPIGLEIEPILQDRRHRQTSLDNSEQSLANLRKFEEDHTRFDTLVQFFSKSASQKRLESHIAEMRDEIQQLDDLIIPRQRELSRLRNELAKIHEAKLQP